MVKFGTKDPEAWVSLGIKSRRHGLTWDYRARGMFSQGLKSRRHGLGWDQRAGGMVWSCAIEPEAWFSLGL